MKRRVSVLFIVFIFIFSPWASSYLISGQFEDFNLIIITLDTTRADYIGFYNHLKSELTPHIDRVAREGIGLRNCYTSVPQTLPSHCSLFTGKYPIAHGVRNNASCVLPDEELTLAEIFRKNGYITYAVVSSYVLVSKFGLSQGFDSYDDALDSNQAINSFGSEIPADRVYRKFSLWLDKHCDRKFFSWVHFFDPHQPYAPPAPYDKQYGGDLYAGEVAYVDHFVGKIIDDLKKKGIYDKTLVVIFGDHGEDLGEHQEFGHATFCYNQTIQVPLIFSKNPGFRTNGPALPPLDLVDVMPVILELYGFDAPGSIQGLSLKEINAMDTASEKRLIYFESMYPLEEMGWAPVIGIIEGRYKYIRLPKAELYDLETDKDELVNMYYKKYNISQDLDRKLKAFIDSHARENKAYHKKLSADDIKHLSTLGYISSFKKTNKMIDPKRGIAFRSQLRTVKQLINDNHLDQAETELANSQKAEPDIRTPIIYDLYEEIYKLKKDPEKLVEKQQESVREFPANNQLKIKLANTYFNLQDFKNAKKLCLDIIEIDPTFSRAFILLAKIELNVGRFAEAKKKFNEAILLEPHNYALKKMVAEFLSRIGQTHEALEILKQIAGNSELLANRFDHPILVKTAAQLVSMGDIALAERVINTILRTDPRNIEALNELAGIYVRRGNPDKAAGLYEKALSIDPNSALTASNRGILNLVLFQKSRDPKLLAEALDCFNSAIEKDPYFAPAVNGRASAKMFMNRVDDAIADWKATLEIDPDFINAYFNLGIVLIRKREKSEALKYLNILHDKYFDRLPKSQQDQLQRLIDEAGRPN
jgi:arylsulfatase A-like enzyme/Tfp pilus assembly protein PilF